MRMMALTAVLLAASAAANAQSVKAGIDAWQQADYETAVKIWRPLAQAGDADAAFNLGQAYRLGRGLPISLAAAQTWYERAARKGHLDAQATLGLLMFNGGNRVGGLRWLKTAADLGEPRAMLTYGTALFNGDAVVRDPMLAYAYVSRAAAQGLPPAKATLAEMDKLIPLDERKKGLAKALDMAGGARKPEPTPAAKQAKPGPKAVAKVQAPASVTTADKALVRAAGRWRIQLGAFAKRASAEALFKKLSGSGPLAGRQPYFIAVGAVTRLQTGPFESRAAATKACAMLAAQGQPCFPVAAK